jgi:hypothetical protein
MSCTLLVIRALARRLALPGGLGLGCRACAAHRAPTEVMESLLGKTGLFLGCFIFLLFNVFQMNLRDFVPNARYVANYGTRPQPSLVSHCTAPHGTV